MEWKPLVFALAIALIYIPMVFMGVNTFFPEPPINECYRAMPVSVNETLQEKTNQEMMECERAYQEERTKYDGWKFIVIMIINIVASFIMLANLDKSIISGLFSGIVITAFTGTIRYIESRTIPGFILLLVLFGIIIYFVNSMKYKK